MKLLIDAGNSRIKWACLVDGALAYHGHLDRQALVGDPAAFAAAIGALPAVPERIVAASVAGPAVQAALEAACAGLFGRHPEWLQSRAEAFGVRNAYRQPAQLGVDRWLALIAAWRRAHRALCVVDAGSALTLDAIDDSGQHLGGVIVPGLEMMQRALLAGTGELAKLSTGGENETDALFATDTRSAITAGCRHALAALIERGLEQLAPRASAPPVLLLAGGDAERLAPLLATAGEHVPHLVLEGLALTLAETR